MASPDPTAAPANLKLPVNPPVKPMLAKAVAGFDKLTRDDLIFEAKWDGFRCIVFRDGDDIVLGSRNERPLTRYFPEMLDPLRACLPKQAVVDGELIVSIDDRLEFDALQQRIHPAESRVNMLAETTPAEFVAFDVLAVGKKNLMDEPFTKRRAELEKMAKKFASPVHLAPATSDWDLAREWFVDFEGAGLDGLIAKAPDGLYEPNKRSQLKLKHIRSADVVVAGFRMHKSGDGVGSLLIGLWDDNGNLNHMGVATSFTAKYRAELLAELQPEVPDDLSDHPWKSWLDAMAHTESRLPGGQSRWSAGKDSNWIPLDCSRVAEIKYGSTLHGRFRATTQLLRWRPDRDPASCTYDQLEEPEPTGVSSVLSAEG